MESALLGSLGVSLMAFQWYILEPITIKAKILFWSLYFSVIVNLVPTF